MKSKILLMVLFAVGLTTVVKAETFDILCKPVTPKRALGMMLHEDWWQQSCPGGVCPTPTTIQPRVVRQRSRTVIRGNGVSYQPRNFGVIVQESWRPGPCGSSAQTSGITTKVEKLIPVEEKVEEVVEQKVQKVQKIVEVEETVDVPKKYKTIRYEVKEGEVVIPQRRVNVCPTNVCPTNVCPQNFYPMNVCPTSNPTNFCPQNFCPQNYNPCIQRNFRPTNNFCPMNNRGVRRRPVRNFFGRVFGGFRSRSVNVVRFISNGMPMNTSYSPRWTVAGGNIRTHMAGPPHFVNTNGISNACLYRMHDNHHDVIGPVTFF